MKTGTTKTTPDTTTKMVVVENDRARIERDIDRHVKSIQTLINKLRPAERQKYFNGFLSHILSEPVTQTGKVVACMRPENANKDYSKLSQKDLFLLEELSGKMELLYRTMDGDTE